MEDIELLRKLIEQISTLKLEELDENSGEFQAWRKSVLRTLDRFFRTNSREYRDFDSIKFGNPSALFSAPFYRKGLQQAKVTLEHYIDELEVEHSKTKAISNKVFIVHGREKTPALELARLIEDRYPIRPILLDEQIMKGQTLIEKLEEHSNVAFAFVILTPDDIGGLKGEPLRERVRQNVIFEWGLFIGKLGRTNVCVLKKGDTEIPSDLKGIGEYRFNQSVRECFLDIENELKNAKLI